MEMNLPLCAREYINLLTKLRSSMANNGVDVPTVEPDIRITLAGAQVMHNSNFSLDEKKRIALASYTIKQTIDHVLGKPADFWSHFIEETERLLYYPDQIVTGPGGHRLYFAALRDDAIEEAKKLLKEAKIKQFKYDADLERDIFRTYYFIVSSRVY